MFVKENLNPKNKKVADCVIRSIAKAENKSWIEIFDTLTELARKNFTVLNDNDLYAEYLDTKYEKINVMHLVNGSKKRYTVKEISQQLKGTYLIRIANHLTVAQDGNYYDTWDCGEKSSYKVWKVIIFSNK